MEEDKLFKKFMAPGDDDTLRKLHEIFMVAPLEEVRRFCEGSMNALIVVEDVFMKRFPKEFAEWNEQFDK